MPAIKVETFGGMIPIVDDHLLQPNNAVYASNAWLLNGRIAPVAAVVPIHTLDNPLARYAFRIPIVSASVKNIADSLWLEFENANTMVVKTPVSGQDDPRYYWTDGQSPPGYTTRSRIEAADPHLLLGVPAPVVPPGVSVTGGAAPVETRAYVYTWVTQYDEEGQPSLPTVVSGNGTGTWHITVTPPTVGVMADRALTKTRIYRTVTSTQGVAGYYFVDEIPIATTSYDDIIPSATVALNNPLFSLNYEMPPADLEGMVPMPNGMVVGWRKNEVWFCEPYLPHAWPSIYTIAVESQIVGIGTWGQSAVVLCEGQPYTITGITPDSMVLAKIQPLEPCGSRGSIVNTPAGVVYASQNGLIQITPYGGNNVTVNMIDKAQFPDMLRIDNTHAAWLINGYFGIGGVSDEVFQVDAFQSDMVQHEDYSSAYMGVWINYHDPRVGVVWFPSDDPVFNIMQDVYTGEVLLIRAGAVHHIDLSADYPRGKYRWRSKEFQLPFKQNWGAARIFFKVPEGPPVDGPTVFRFICDEQLKFEETLITNGQVFRMPSGFKPDMVQFEVEGYLEIFNIQIGQSPRDLRAV